MWVPFFFTIDFLVSWWIRILLILYFSIFFMGYDEFCCSCNGNFSYAFANYRLDLVRSQLSLSPWAMNSYGIFKSPSAMNVYGFFNPSFEFADWLEPFSTSFLLNVKCQRFQVSLFVIDFFFFSFVSVCNWFLGSSRYKRINFFLF